MPIRRLTPLALLAAPLLTLAACGGEESTADTQPAADLTVISRSLNWDKTAYEATATGGKLAIRLENDDITNHNLHAIDANGTDSGTVLDANPKQSDTKVFTLAPGTYTLICTVPGHGNMKATLTVK